MELLGERVDDRDADAVQAAGDLVAAAVAELAAGVQDGQHDLDGRLALLLHRRDRDAAAVVDDGDRVVRVDRDVDAVAVAGERLVDRVVDDLVDQVVQAAHAGRADVHAGALAHGLEALEDGDVLGVVARARLAGLVGVVCQGVLRVTHATPRREAVATAGAWRLNDHKISTTTPRSGPARRQRKCCKTAQNARHRGAGRACGRQALDRRPPEVLVEPLDDPLGEQVELLRPDRRRARHGDHAVALGDRRRTARRTPRRRPPATRAGPPRAASRARAGRRRSRSSATPSGRGRAAPHAASWSTAPSAIASRVTPASSAPGTCARSVVVITLWPPAAARRPAARAAGVELAHHVVEQHQRRRAARPRPAPRARRAAARAGPSRCWPREP